MARAEKKFLVGLKDSALNLHGFLQRTTFGRLFNVVAPATTTFLTTTPLMGHFFLTGFAIFPQVVLATSALAMVNASVKDVRRNLDLTSLTRTRNGVDNYKNVRRIITGSPALAKMAGALGILDKKAKPRFFQEDKIRSRAATPLVMESSALSETVDIKTTVKTSADTLMECAFPLAVSMALGSPALAAINLYASSQWFVKVSKYRHAADVKIEGMMRDINAQVGATTDYGLDFDPKKDTVASLEQKVYDANIEFDALMKLDKELKKEGIKFDDLNTKEQQTRFDKCLGEAKMETPSPAIKGFFARTKDFFKVMKLTLNPFNKEPRFAPLQEMQRKIKVVEQVAGKGSKQADKKKGVGGKAAQAKKEKMGSLTEGVTQKPKGFSKKVVASKEAAKSAGRGRGAAPAA
jgi:hypothetical protein